MRRRLGKGRVWLPRENFGWFYDTHERRPTPLIPTLYNIKIQIGLHINLPVNTMHLLNLEQELIIPSFDL